MVNVVKSEKRVIKSIIKNYEKGRFKNRYDFITKYNIHQWELGIGINEDKNNRNYRVIYNDDIFIYFNIRFEYMFITYKNEIVYGKNVKKLTLDRDWW